LLHGAYVRGRVHQDNVVVEEWSLVSSSKLAGMYPKFYPPVLALSVLGGLCGEVVYAVDNNVVETHLINVLVKLLQDSRTQKFVGRRYLCVAKCLWFFRTEICTKISGNFILLTTEMWMLYMHLRLTPPGI